jgi:hypothetical protein
VLAALNHSNIAVIYDIEKSVETHALIMELVEVEKLEEHLARKTIQVGKMADPPYNYAPTIKEGLDDLKKMQKAIWGRLGY